MSKETEDKALTDMYIEVVSDLIRDASKFENVKTNLKKDILTSLKTVTNILRIEG